MREALEFLEGAMDAGEEHTELVEVRRASGG